jgi:hypothetical protein
MARLTLVTFSALLSIAATVGVIVALAGRGRLVRRNAPPEPRTCPMFELLMQ